METSTWASTPGVARSMRGNRARDTKPELLVRRALHARGLRFRVDYRPSPTSRSRGDVVFTRLRLIVFIDGCFWHGCPIHATTPTRNADYWEPKLERNKQRDIESTALFEGEGWTVMRFWEHEAPEEIARAVSDSVEVLQSHLRREDSGSHPSRQRCGRGEV